MKKERIKGKLWLCGCLVWIGSRAVPLPQGGEGWKPFLSEERILPSCQSLIPLCVQGGGVLYTSAPPAPVCQSPSPSLDTYLESKGLVDVQQLDPTIRVRLIYAEKENFLQEKVYEGMTKAWLRPEAARMLAEAQRLLKRAYPGRTLIVYDAARPMSVQRKMWERVRGTGLTNYVSNPAKGGGLHNYGMAVDVSILNETGRPLPMGTPVDFFGKEAHTTDEETLVREGRITVQERENRLLLRRIMRQAGFRTILYEWWHFNACSRASAREHYPVID